MLNNCIAACIVCHALLTLLMESMPTHGYMGRQNLGLQDNTHCRTTDRTLRGLHE